jgi:D-glycero-alpha-D-manno-heptose-7-phosphate kinase
MSGVGSSSAFVIAMINLLNFIKYKKKLDSKNLANQAIFFEQEILKECVGVQDQIICAYGGFNRISIDKKGNYKVKNLMNNYHKRINLLTDSLLLIYTGVRRFSNHEALSQKNKIIQSDLSFLSESALNAEKIIKNKNVSIYEIGRLLKSNWEIKKTLSKKMTIPQSEEIISLCMKNGGVGGKVLGTGNGGFVLFQVKKEYQRFLIKKLKKFLVLKFKCFNGKPSINEVII